MSEMNNNNLVSTDIIELPDFPVLTKENIKALSWKAPYAQLMLRDKIETRTWPTKYRGWVLICCSKMEYSRDQLMEIAGLKLFGRIVFDNGNVLNNKFHLGQAIAIGKLVDCRPMTKADEDACFVKYKEPWTATKTLVSGNIKKTPKQLWCHIYEEVMPIDPFHFTGGQGWKNLTDKEIKSIKPVPVPINNKLWEKI